MKAEVFTIGHSNHEIAFFVELLNLLKITAVADVRSVPHSKYVPHFEGGAFSETMSKNKIAYVFLGNELGGRSANPNYYIGGRIDYNLLSRDPLFQEGLLRVKKGSSKFRIALMCAEKDPIDCHRGLLIAPHLSKLDLTVKHIHANRVLETQDEFEKRLLTKSSSLAEDMFVDKQEALRIAYERQIQRAAATKLLRREKAEDNVGDFE